MDRFTHDYERGPASLEELVEKEYMGSIPTDPFTGSNQTWQVETTPLITTPHMNTPNVSKRPVNPFRSFPRGFHGLYSVTSKYDMNCGILIRGDDDIGG
jgi:hypothetical protein